MKVEQSSEYVEGTVKQLRPYLSKLVPYSLTPVYNLLKLLSLLGIAERVDRVLGPSRGRPANIWRIPLWFKIELEQPIVEGQTLPKPLDTGKLLDSIPPLKMPLKEKEFKPAKHQKSSRPK